MSDQSQGFGDQGSQGTGDQQQQMSDLGSDFLKGIPDNERPIVEKYVKDWDRGVNGRFQDIHSQYAPYKDLGDVEAVKQAVAIAQMLDENPEHVYQLLTEALTEAGKLPGNYDQNPQAPAPQSNPSLQVPPEFNQYLSPFQDQVTQQGKMLEQLAQIVVQTNQAARDADEDKQLTSYLGQLKEKHGVEFDEQAILLQMYHGVDGDKAVENWKASVMEAAKALGITTYQGPNPPPPLTGGGVPNADTSVNDMDRKSVQGLVANIMQAANSNQ